MYDIASNTWATLDDTEAVKSILASCESKNMVAINTGKVAWDKYDIYIQEIAECASGLGFALTIVTDDIAQGLMVSKVIQHRQ